MVLLQQHRYEGSWYLCGYAMEYYLKARICTTLQWKYYPMDDLGDFGRKAFQTHNLAVLLKLSGRMTQEEKSPIFKGNWSVVVKWNPDKRYDTNRTITRADAEGMIAATKELMELL